MENTKFLKKPHSSPLSRYYSAAAVACIDAVAFTSACTMIPITTDKPSPNQACKSSYHAATAKQAHIKEKWKEDLPAPLHFLKQVRTDEESPSSKTLRSSLNTEENPSFKTVKLVQMDDNPSLKTMRLGLTEGNPSSKSARYLKQNDDTPSLKTVRAVQKEDNPSSKTGRLVHPKKDQGAITTPIATTPIKSPASQHLPLHYQPPSPCSVCGKPLQVGWPTRSLSYAEIKAATNNFSRNNFLFEGESSFVYGGGLSDGKQVAVKSVGQKTAKFHSEVKILSSVQHPNVISLVGYCDEPGKAMLVYDFICNGTLDWHLSGRNPNVVPWHGRKIIAVQVARGLQFLHECKLGCLLHQDIRARNILLTHDYVPVIAGFGHARWAHIGEELQNAPQAKASHSPAEDAATADVYAFGVLLLELISGRTVVDPHEDLQPLVAWARPLLLEDFEAVVNEILDPRLGLHYKHYELFCMVNAASMCIRKDPSTRPCMRLILSCLEDARERSRSTPFMDFVQAKPATAWTTSHTTYQQAAPCTVASLGCQYSTKKNNKKKKDEDKKKPSLTVSWQLPADPSKPSNIRSQRPCK